MDTATKYWLRSVRYIYIRNCFRLQIFLDYTQKQHRLWKYQLRPMRANNNNATALYDVNNFFVSTIWTPFLYTDKLVRDIQTTLNVCECESKRFFVCTQTISKYCRIVGCWRGCGTFPFLYKMKTIPRNTFIY